jgi:pimeloyl-ACP methyl ester carboxylesterase
VVDFLKLAAGVVIGLPLVMYLLQDRLVFHPRPLPDEHRARIAARVAAAESVFLPATDGTRLHAWRLKAPRGAPLVIYFGGNAEEISWMIGEALARTPGVGWLLVDYRGYGSSGGAPSEATLSADARLWYDHVANEAGRVLVFGRSLGSGVAVRLAAERPVAGVIVVAPFDSLVAVARHHFPFLPVSWMLRHRFDSAERAPGMAVPLLCLVARHDEIIPAIHSKRLYEAWGGPKRWVEVDGGHNTTDGAPGFWQSIQAFVTETRGGGGRQPAPGTSEVPASHL